MPSDLVSIDDVIKVVWESIGIVQVFDGEAVIEIFTANGNVSRVKVTSMPAVTVMLDNVKFK